MPIIPELIEAGVDNLNPIQPVTMDPFMVKREWGSVVVLRGGVGLQETMTQPSAEVVRERTARLVEAWAPGGGAIACPANDSPIDIPRTNVVAFMETAEESRREAFSRLTR